MQDNTDVFSNKIIKINIDEKNDSVTYYMENGKFLSSDLTYIMNNKKNLFKNFKISQKCHELTNSFLKRRKLEKLINPVIVKGLNDNVDIMEYIRCVNNENPLPFDLEHFTVESSLKRKDRALMKNIAKHEGKLGGKVNIIDENIFNRIKSKLSKIINEPKESKVNEDISVIPEETVDKTCEDVNKFIVDNYLSSNEELEDIRELESMEFKLKTAINWYIKNKKTDKAQININRYKDILKIERKRFYKPKIERKENQELPNDRLRKIAEPYVIKDYELNKLVIRNLIARGKIEQAEEKYIDILNNLGIKLTTRELNKSLREGWEYGFFYTKDEFGFRKHQIIGNERMLKILENLGKKEQKKEENIKKEQVQEQQSKETQKRNIHNKEEKIYTKDEIKTIIEKNDKLSERIKYQKGALVPVVDALISYLKLNKDIEVQNYLNTLINQFDEIEPIDLIRERIGTENKYNLVLFDYISDLYKNGIQNYNGENIVEQNERKYGYYTYLLNRKIENDFGKGKLLSEEKIKTIKEEYNKNSEDIELYYFETLLLREKKESIGLKNKLMKSEKYSKAIQELEGNSQNDNIKFLALSEDLKNGVYRKQVGLPTNLKLYKTLREKTIKKIELNETTEPRILKLVANIESQGIKNQLGNEIVEANKDIANKIFRRIPKENIINEEENKKSNNLTVKKETKSLFRKKKPSKVEKRIGSKTSNKEQNIYVCSDLHGQFELYKTILDQLKDDDKLYILGDVIDRGPDGIKILEDIRQNRDKIELFVGNHEIMMIQSLFLNNDKEKQNWQRESNGGNKTQDDYLKLSLKEKIEIKNLLLQATVHDEIIVNGEKIYLVHAKADNNTDRKKETVADYMRRGRNKELFDSVWARVDDIKDKNSNEVWKEEDIAKENMYTIIGHTPTNNNKIEVHNLYAIIDCGATNYGNGCLLRLNDGKAVYFDNVTRCLEQLKDETER